MGSQTILFICLGLTAIQTVRGQLWEFGADNIPSATLITRYKGHFNFFQKDQHIQLIVPECHVVTYVNVQVKNYLSSPTVFYNYQTNKVSIHYSFWQISSSTFTITAKGVWLDGCNIQQPNPVGPAFGQQIQNGPQIPFNTQPQVQYPQQSPQDHQMPQFAQNRQGQEEEQQNNENVP